MPPKPGCHTICYRPYPLEVALDGIARAGFERVELAAIPGVAEHVDVRASPDPVLERCVARGLEIVSLSAHADLTTRCGLEHAMRAICWAAAAGVTYVNTAVGGQWTDAAGEAELIARLHALADTAEASGVVVSLEIDGPLMGSGERALPVMQRIGREEIRVNYDTANCTFETGVSAMIDLPLILPYVAHVHLKDTAGGRGTWDFPPLGEGIVNFPAVLRILDAAAYVGPMVVEIEFQGDPWPDRDVVDRAVTRSYRYLSSVTLP